MITWQRAELRIASDYLFSSKEIILESAWFYSLGLALGGLPRLLQFDLADLD